MWWIFLIIPNFLRIFKQSGFVKSLLYSPTGWNLRTNCRSHIEIEAYIFEEYAMFLPRNFAAMSTMLALGLLIGGNLAASADQVMMEVVRTSSPVVPINGVRIMQGAPAQAVVVPVAEGDVPATQIAVPVNGVGFPVTQVITPVSNVVPVSDIVPVSGVVPVTTVTPVTTISAPLETTSTITRRTVVTSGTPVSTTTTVSSVISSAPLSFSDAQNILQTVDLRRAELDRRLIESRSSGLISEVRASILRQELDRIGAEVALLKGQPAPSILRALALAKTLDVVSADMGTLSVVVPSPIIEGLTFTIYNGGFIKLDDLAERRIGLESKIATKEVQGKITFSQAARLRSQLNDIALAESAYRASGKLSFDDSRKIYVAYDHVGSELDSWAR